MITNKRLRLEILYFLMVLFITTSCTSFKFLPEDFEGIYEQKDLEGYKLVFKDGTFSHIDTYEQAHMPPFDCCDTISYGYWELEKPGVLKLFSDPKLFLPLDLLVKESKTASDSVYFIITNPIENLYEENERPEILYTLFTNAGRGFNFSMYHDSNKISFENPNKKDVKRFNISIYPKHTFRGRNIGTREAVTVEYSVKDVGSNVFEIQIPELDYGYLTYKRLNDDYVKIVNKNKLIWDGNVFIKK